MLSLDLLIEIIFYMFSFAYTYMDCGSMVGWLFVHNDNIYVLNCGQSYFCKDYKLKGDLELLRNSVRG